LLFLTSKHASSIQNARSNLKATKQWDCRQCLGRVELSEILKALTSTPDCTCVSLQSADRHANSEIAFK